MTIHIRKVKASKPKGKPIIKIGSSPTPAVRKTTRR